MTCKSSAIKALSCILILLSVIIFVNWIIAFVGDLDDYSWIFGYYYSRNAGYWFDGLWVGPILVSGIVGLTTACGDTACKRIALLVIGSLSLIPTVCMFIPLAVYFDGDYYYSYSDKYICDRHYGSQNEYYNCHRLYNIPDGRQTYSAIQMFLVSLAVLTDLCLVIITGIHHCGGCCGSCKDATPPSVGPAAVPVMLQPGMYLVPQPGQPILQPGQPVLQPGLVAPQPGLVAPPAGLQPPQPGGFQPPQPGTSTPNNMDSKPPAYSQ